MSDMFPIKNGFKWGNVLSPFFFSFVLEYAITRVQVKHEGLKVSGKFVLFINSPI